MLSLQTFIAITCYINVVSTKTQQRQRRMKLFFFVFFFVCYFCIYYKLYTCISEIEFL